jgi:hypothetical protein
MLVVKWVVLPLQIRTCVSNIHMTMTSGFFWGFFVWFPGLLVALLNDRSPLFFADCLHSLSSHVYNNHFHVLYVRRLCCLFHFDY